MGQKACKFCGLADWCDSTVEDMAKFLAQVTLFKGMPPDTHRTLAMIATTVEFKRDEYIVKQGDEADEFWVLWSGKCAVFVDGTRMATLRPYDYFGERALLQQDVRTASVQAIELVTAVKIPQHQFKAFSIADQLRFAHRKAVGGHHDDQISPVKPPTPKTPSDRKMMKEALNANQLLCLTDNQLNQVIDKAWTEHIPANTEIISEGDENADYFYIVKEGNFEVFIRDDRGGSAAFCVARQRQINTVSPGQVFGEMALLYRDPRTATVKSVDSGIVWVLDRSTFQEILSKTDEVYMAEHAKYLENVEVLKDLSMDEKQAVAKALRDVSLTQDEIIFKQGDEGDAFFILTEGEVRVIENGAEVRRLTAEPDKAVHFGERALINNDVRSATIQVSSETGKALLLDRESFEILLGGIEELRKGAHGSGALRRQSTFLGVAQAVSKNNKINSIDSNSRKFGLIRLKDLRDFGLLGCGGFGAVTMVEHKVTGATYALKQLSKGYVIKTGMQHSIMSEKEVQLLCDSPFIIKLYETYNTSESLYFLLELALGGELYATYNRKGFHGSETHAHFYIAGVVYAFEHLHSKKVIYRDLKPENLLLTARGFVKLTDMGLAKVVIGKSYTTCGTPDYFAPEMVSSVGHNQAVDWWTLGILTFELMTGHPPFESPTAMLIYQKVNHGIEKVHFPKSCRGPAEDLVKGLCQRSPSRRLPMRVGGIENIRTHPWMKNFQWAAMSNGSLTPPFQPPVDDKRDLRNFTVRKDDIPPQLTYKDPGTNWDKGFATST